ncbi:phage holin family protein [Achromobacter aegrifaciens]|uniref:phage holin family protein n=1 Tax=Achromobacter aegrifaciens TaxID=1287736 RepID=UPI0032090F29
MQPAEMISMGHQHLVALLFVVANFASAVRLLLYRRNGARFRRGMSWLAYLLIVGTGGQALDVLVRHEPVTVWQAVVAMLIAVLVYRAQGNVACIVRVNS